MQVQANGNKFDITIKAIKRGSWVVQIDKVNGLHDGFWFGEIRSEREARQAAKAYCNRYTEVVS